MKNLLINIIAIAIFLGFIFGMFALVELAINVIESIGIDLIMSRMMKIIYMLIPVGIIVITILTIKEEN